MKTHIMTLEIITRCTRPENLSIVKKSIFDNKPEDIDVYWHIIFDTRIVGSISTEILSEVSIAKCYFWESTPDDMGHSLINKIFDEEVILGGCKFINHWVYILDDDNILHPNFYNKLTETLFLDPHNEIGAIIFSQFVGGKDFTGLQIREAKPENVKVQHIDMAQFVLNKELIKKTRFISNEYKADGIFIEELYKANPDKFIFLDKILCYYNFLQKKEQPRTLPRILVCGATVQELKSLKLADFESNELYLTNPDQNSIKSSIVEHDPDCFLTIGEYKKFHQLCELPLDFRSRWINLAEINERTGENAYLCAMHSILDADTSTLVSIFTPTYNTGEKLKRTYESIKAQSYNNWEWVIVNDSTDLITGKIAQEIAKQDPRVKVYEFKEKTKGIIGESKYRACVLTRGNYLLELDHDDYLTPDALDLMVSAFIRYPDAGFAYSDCAEIDENYKSLKYGDGFAMGYGKYREEYHFNRTFEVAVAPNINPKTIRHIVGVPNHFRAWKREAYFKAGCHNRRLSIADDYELIIRTFLTTKMVKIQRGCYLQFFHGQNSQDSTRADIQRRVRTISQNYSAKIKARFEELGKEDWAFELGLSAPKRIGDSEGFVNYIYEKQV